MHVLHINGSGSWGGNEQQLADLIPELEKLGVKNTVMGRPGSPLHDYCKANNIDFKAAKNGKLSRKANYRYLKQLIKTEEIELLHLHSSDSVTLFTIADMLYKLQIPTVFSKKGMSRSMSRLSIFKYNFKNINTIICVSNATRKAMQEKVLKPRNHDKLTVIYDGININRLAPVRHENIRELFNIPSNKRLLGNIANHTAAKDLPTLLRMMHHLVYVQKIDDVHLVQMGKFSGLTEELQALQKELKLENFLTFTDFQNHATDFLPQFEIYVMSSEREGLPLTVYEAFYKKVPVVSTQAGGIPEVVTDGENGLLAGVGDYKVLAEKAGLLLNDLELQRKFRENSFELFLKKFTADATAKKTLEIYKNAMQ